MVEWSKKIALQATLSKKKVNRGFDFSISSMILEFIGLPGAGKSTHMPPLMKLLEQNQIQGNDYTSHHKRVMSSLRGRILFFLFIALNSKRVFRLIRTVSGANNLKRKLKDRIIPLLTMLHCIRQYHVANPSSILLMDQGIIQMVCSIYYRMDSYDGGKIKMTIAQSLAFISDKVNYHTILFDLPLNVAKERIRTRNKEGCEFGDMKEDNLIQALAYYDTFLRNIPASLIVDAEGEIRENATHIYERLID